MPIEEICKLIAQKLLQGCMNHQEFANYYQFLGLQGYKLKHEYHFFEQMYHYRKFIQYYLQTENKIIPQFSSQSLTSSSFSIIPSNWYGYIRQDVDLNTRRNAVKSGLEKYIHWEDQVKSFLEEMYIECINQRYVSLSLEIQKYLCYVEQQIKEAERKHLEIKASDYDLPTIVSEQQQLVKKYTKKLDFMRKEFDQKYVKSS